MSNRVFIDFTSRNDHDLATKRVYARSENTVDIRLARNHSGRGVLYKLLRHFLRLRDIAKCDTLHFYAGKGVFPFPVRWRWAEKFRFVGFRTLSLLGKSIFLHYQGCDLRYFRRESAEKCGDCPLKEAYCGSENVRRRQTSLRNALPFVRGVTVSTPDLLDYLPLNVEHAVEWFPKCLDETVVAELKSGAGTSGLAKPRAIHAPSNPAIKGTKFVLAAAEALDETSNAFTLELVSGMPRSKVIAVAKSCDFALDQFHLGFYGTFTVEMMYAGLPVFVYISPSAQKFLMERFQPHDRLPFIHVDQASDLQKSIVAFLNSRPEEIETTATMAQDYLQRFHTIDGEQFQKITQFFSR